MCFRYISHWRMARHTCLLQSGGRLEKVPLTRCLVCKRVAFASVRVARGKLCNRGGQGTGDLKPSKARAVTVARRAPLGSLPACTHKLPT